MTESLDNTTKERDELKAKLETATDDLEISRVNIKEKTEHDVIGRGRREDRF